MNARNTLSAALGAVTLVGGEARGRDISDAPVILGESLQPLIEHFNGGAGRPRVVALVSPTCPACIFGAEAVRTSVLESFPDAELLVSVVWIDMLPTDNAASAQRSSAIFDDPRVKQFHDPGRRSGNVLGEQLLYGGAGPAWDIYLFYGADARWGERPPEPRDWFHQLSGGRRADPVRFRPGDRLVEALRKATRRLLEGDAPEVGAAAPPPRLVAFRGNVLRVEGMDCAGCVADVSGALAEVAGVAEVDVSLDTGLAWVRVDNAVSVDYSTLIEAVKKAGFRAAPPAKGEVLEIPARFLVPRVELLMFPGCPDAAALGARVREACARLGLDCRVEQVNLLELDDDDPRRGYGSPTVLVDGADLMGQPPSRERAIACRRYPGDALPAPAEIADRLARCRATAPEPE